MTRARVFLDAPNGRRELPVGSYVLGRSGDCDVVLENARASRCHARIVVSETGASIEDLGSANGTYVNGTRVVGHPHKLGDDDFVVIGDVGLEVLIRSGADADALVAERKPAPAASFESKPPPTARSTVQQVLTSAADFALGSGQFDMAERTLESWLTDVLSNAKSGVAIADEDREGGQRYGVELAVALASARWVHYVLELATATQEPIADDRSRLLTPIIEKTGVAADALEGYIAMLESLPEDTRGRRSLERAVGWRERTVASR